MMRNFKDYLLEVQTLTEANVRNPEGITAYANQFAQKVGIDVGKQWFSKKVRAFLINSEEMLVPVPPMHPDVAAKLPDYLRAALEKGETIYSFNPENSKLTGLTQTLTHIADWFNAMAEVAESQPDAQNKVATQDKVLAQRELSKVMKMSIEQAHEAADAWFKAMGNRVKGKKNGVEGGEIMLEWPDGYYAIRFTDRTTMMRDGKDLQNCLATGTYWNNVVDGSNIVVAIRKPNDEAVVGMRFSKKTGKLDTIECKGKNNDPVTPPYVPYVIDLLKHINANPNTTHDLKNAGIHFHNGEYGTFEDIAELVYDENGVKVWRSATDFLGRSGSAALRGKIMNDKITSVEFGDQKMRNVVAILNGLGLPPVPHLASYLSDSFIYEHEGRYGTPKDVGQPLGEVAGHKMFRVNEIVFGFDGDHAVFQIQLNDRGTIVTDIPDVDTEVPIEALVECLNHVGRKPNAFCQHNSLFVHGIVFDGTKYGEPADLGVVEASRTGNASILRIGKQNLWCSIVRGTPHALYQMSSGGSFSRVAVRNTETDRQAGFVVRELLGKIDAKKVDDPNSYGVIETPFGIIASKQTLFAHASKIMSMVNDRNAGALQWDSNTSDGPIEPMQMAAFLRAEGEFTAKEQDALMKMLAADKKEPALIIETTAHKMFDLNIRTYQVYLPCAIFAAWEALGLTQPRKAREDIMRGIKQVEHFVATTPARFNVANFDHTAATEVGLEAEYSKMLMAIRQSTEKLNAEIKERETNKDKYATDLSSRFAAMNALRKVKGK